MRTSSAASKTHNLVSAPTIVGLMALASQPASAQYDLRVTLSMASCTVISHGDPLSPTAGVLIGTFDTEKEACQGAKDHFHTMTGRRFMNASPDLAREIQVLR